MLSRDHHGPPGSTSPPLIKAICHALEPERFGGEMDWNRIELGFTIEKVIEAAWAARRVEIIRPGEIEKDGISGSPDGLSFDDAGPVVEEIKCTWMSLRDCPEGKKFWHWIVQMKAYCYLTESTARGCTGSLSTVITHSIESRRTAVGISSSHAARSRKIG